MIYNVLKIYLIPTLFILSVIIIIEFYFRFFIIS